MSVGEHSAGALVGRRWPITAGRGLLVVGLVAAGLTLLLGHAMVAPFGHDEHQFVFSGQLLADQALLPYLDFPYNHSPYAARFSALSIGATRQTKGPVANSG